MRRDRHGVAPAVAADGRAGRGRHRHGGHHGHRRRHRARQLHGPARRAWPPPRRSPPRVTCALVGLPTDEALRQAATASPAHRDAADAAVLLPAGARDHYLGLPGSDPRAGAAGHGPRAMLGARPVVAVDVAADAGWLVPAARGGGPPGPARSAGRSAVQPAMACRGAAGGARRSTGQGRRRRIPATLVPRYVALPRGIPAATAAAADALEPAAAGEGTWSPGFR